MDQFRSVIQEMERMMVSARSDYVKWLAVNPGRASDIESSVKVLSYLLQGRLRHSTIIPELLYCSSNLLAFWHDRLLHSEAIRKRNSQLGEGSKDQEILNHPKEAQILRIKSTLTILEYFEVFLEVSAKQLWGDIGRWLVIIIVQAVKTGLRAALLFHYKVGIIESPPLQPYKRGRPTKGGEHFSKPNLVFVLKHSGRVVRKIHAAPPLSFRTWKLPTIPAFSVLPHDLPPARLAAEIIHIMRPLSHLISLGIWGTKSWKPWLLSLGMDVTSLQLHGQPSRLQRSEKEELTRRTYALLYYLMRSPFYDRFTKRRLFTALNMLSGRVPLIGNLFAVVAQAIPDWQDTYSYIWNDC